MSGLDELLGGAAGVGDYLGGIGCGQRRDSFVYHSELPTKADWVGSTGLGGGADQAVQEGLLVLLDQLGHLGHIFGRVDRGIVQRASAQDGGIVWLERRSVAIPRRL